MLSFLFLIMLSLPVLFQILACLHTYNAMNGTDLLGSSDPVPYVCWPNKRCDSAWSLFKCKPCVQTGLARFLSGESSDGCAPPYKGSLNQLSI